MFWNLFRSRRGHPPVRRSKHHPPRIEALEDRVMPAQIFWTNSVGGPWHLPENWSLNRLPGPEDDVFIPDYPGSINISLSSGTNTTIRKLEYYENVALGGTLKLETASGAPGSLRREMGSSAVFTMSGTLLKAVAEANTLLQGQGRLGGALGSDDRVTLKGTLQVSESGTMTVSNTLTLDGGTVSLNRSVMSFAGNQTLEGNGTVVFASNVTAVPSTLTQAAAGQTLTLGPGITVRGPGRLRVGRADATFVNLGTILANTPTTGVSLNGSNTPPPIRPPTSNRGTIQAENGGHVSFIGPNWQNESAGRIHAFNRGLITTAGSWSNQGELRFETDSTFTAAGSWSNEGILTCESRATLNLGGSFRLTDGQLACTGATVNFTGTLNNTASTLTLTAGSTWTLSGLIQGGTVRTEPEARLTAASGTLASVTLNGHLEVSAAMTNQNVSVLGGLTLRDGRIDLGNANGTHAGRLRFTGTQALDGNGTVAFGSHASNGVGPTSPGQTLTIGPNITLRGHSGTIGSGNATLTVQGTIAAEAPSGTLIVAGNLTNFADGTLTGGSWRVSDNSTLRLPLTSGIVTNAATLILNGPASQLQQADGNDALGPLAVNEAASLLLGEGRQHITAGFFRNAGTLNVGIGSLFVVNGTYLQTVGLTRLAGGTVAVAGDIAIQAGVTEVLAGLLFAAGTMRNTGTMLVEANGTVFAAADYLQTGGLTRLDQSYLFAAMVDLRAGRLFGTGLLFGNVVNAARIDVGGEDAIGLLFVSGNYTQTADGTLHLEIGGRQGPGVGSDGLIIAGAASFAGTLRVRPLNGFTFLADDAFPVLAFESCQGTFTPDFPDLGPGLEIVADYGASLLTLRVRTP